MLKFLSLDMESIGDCGFDYVAVYNGKKSVICAQPHEVTVCETTDLLLFNTFVSATPS